MLGKEEIEFNLKALSGVMLNFEDRLCDEMQERIKEVKEYIEDLESREQKLIEKLEEESKQLEHDILTMSIDTGNNYSLKLINEAKGMKKQNDRILEMLKN